MGSDTADPRRTLVGIGAASSLGMTVAGGLLFVGRAALARPGRPPGVARAQVVALLAAAVAIVGGRLVTSATVSAGVGRSLLAGLVGAAGDASCCWLSWSG